MPAVKGVAGTRVAVLLDVIYVTTPGSAAVPGPVNVILVALMVAGFMASLKVTVMGELGQTPVAPATGVTEAINGAA